MNETRDILNKIIKDIEHLKRHPEQLKDKKHERFMNGLNAALEIIRKYLEELK